MGNPGGVYDNQRTGYDRATGGLGEGNLGTLVGQTSNDGRADCGSAPSDLNNRGGERHADLHAAAAGAAEAGVGPGVGSDVGTCGRFGSGCHACTGVGEQRAYSDTAGVGTTRAILRTGVPHQNTLCETPEAGATR